MTEPVPASLHFTRWRVLFPALAVALVAVAVALVLGLAKIRPADPLVISITGFRQWAYGTWDAVVTLSNKTSSYFLAVGDAELRYQPHREGVRIGIEIATEGRLPGVASPKSGFVIPPHAFITNTFTLPADGRKGRFVIHALEEHGRLLALPERVRQFLRLTPTGFNKPATSICPDLIQCPRVRPDGGLEPARFVEKGK